MKSFKRAVVGVLAAAGVAAGSLVGVSEARAATPNLVLTGGVYCQFAQPGTEWKNAWSMTRFMTVTARGADFPNVTLQEIGGATKFTRKLEKDKSMTIKTTWFGCFPSSISGYTISDYAENLLDNAGFWWNVRRIDNPFNRFSPGSQSGGGVNVAGTPEIPAR
ncbi:hypothetical protein [Gordonia aurantiaca]|uniref:hypothetical protein n=1 Tax=Gordonia sp. B21 TaxID=3151852 RepID=UPI0032648E5A